MLDIGTDLSVWACQVAFQTEIFLGKEGNCSTEYLMWTQKEQDKWVIPVDFCLKLSEEKK